jgi:precorrin-6Y C5,15-methyltransferase (decarboxylating)
VVGLAGDTPTPEGAAALAQADLVIGSARHLEAVTAGRLARQLTLWGDVPAILDAAAAEPGTVCVLASGDPGFFGIVRPLAERFGSAALAVHPAPSSVALAFARLGLPWDDATIVSAHGRPLTEAAAIAATSPKAAVLVSPSSPPESLGRHLLELGAAHTQAAVCTRLGLEGERVDVTDLAGLAAGSWDPLSVVVLTTGHAVAAAKTLAWGRPAAEFVHQAGMITKAEVRAAVLANLDLPERGVLWDVGAGSGSVAVESAALAPGLTVLAIERRTEDCRRVAANAAVRGARIRVIEGTAPGCLHALPDPDRVFVGGGGLDVLDAVLVRLRAGGRVVATFAALDRAAAAADRLGSLAQIAVGRGARLPDGGWRLEAENPVFVTWGPTP